MNNTYDQNVDLIIDQLDAQLRRKASPEIYQLNRRYIITGQPSLRVIALRYMEALAAIKRENKRKGRATARRIAQDRDDYREWLKGWDDMDANIAARPVVVELHY